jgi:hypothetical protein
LAVRYSIIDAGVAVRVVFIPATLGSPPRRGIGANPRSGPRI